MWYTLNTVYCDDGEMDLVMKKVEGNEKGRGRIVWCELVGNWWWYDLWGWVEGGIDGWWNGDEWMRVW
jgi:hypothetical protein